MKKTGKKGFTLTELTVVLGLVAIISVMVVSFAVMMSHRTRLSAARLDAMNDMEAVEAFVEGWLGQMQLQGAEVSLVVHEITDETTGETTRDTRLQAAKDEWKGRLFFDENSFTLIGDLPDDTFMTYTPAVVTGMKFMQVEKFLDETDKLFFCSLTYTLPGVTNGAEDRNVQVICFNPHVGDTYGSGGGAS